MPPGMEKKIGQLEIPGQSTFIMPWLTSYRRILFCSCAKTRRKMAIEEA